MTTHNAPPVVYPLGRSAFQGLVLLGLWLTGLVAVLLWIYGTGQPPWAALTALFVSAAAALAALQGWKNSQIGQLAWDGQRWRWESSGYQTDMAEQELVVLADFQRLLLIRLENQAQAHLWLWVERRAMPERWMDFRRAVYSPHRLSDAGRAESPRPADSQLDMAVSADVHSADNTRLIP